MVKQIYKTDMFIQQQTQQIQAALNMYEGNTQLQTIPDIIPQSVIIE
jgi:hypothetical protein